MATIINYKSIKLRDMVDKGYMSLHDVSLAEKEINSIAEELVKSLMDRGYDPLK